MKRENLTSEQMEKVKACATAEELVALAESEGYELSDDELAAMSGGSDWWPECNARGCEARHI